MKHLFFIFGFLFLANCLFSQDFVWFDGKTPVTYSIENSRDGSRTVSEVALSAIEMWKSDLQQVTGFVPKEVPAGKAVVRIVQTDTIQTKEAFHIYIQGKQIFVVGSDSRGTAYGILELSRLAGVSPWVWWSDIVPEKKNKLTLPKGFQTFQSPSVEYRGIFLNDEDWGLMPWSSKTFEPDAKTKFPVENRFKGQIGPKTYEKIFQLLLRLRANTIWPAMHEVTMPFYFVEGNRQMAEKYGITVSTSHCEPMMRNSATEWDLTGNGAYNYFTNREHVIEYWTDRLKELGNSENIFTIGMRGKHDGRMEGAHNVEEYKNAITQVLDDQKEMLKKYINPDVAKIPQQFIPYKEVLDVYRAGLEVPDYVTLVWPDDNHGYIRHFPNEKEQARSGGNGVYYHTSYWGEPHDNIWLGIVQPSLMYQQMKLAYDCNVRKIWILNVGDIKPSEYLTELFLDMAWNINSITSAPVHLQNWLQCQFDEKTEKQLLPVMEDFYLLSHIRKPEFMGNTRTYDKNFDKISDLPLSKKEIMDRLSRFRKISDEVENIENTIPENRKSAYFELIKYPVQASAQMNYKLLFAQLARHNDSIPVWLKSGGDLWEKSDAAFDSIVSLTGTYNLLMGGKWKYMMDYKPRNLIVYQRVEHQTDSLPLPACRTPLNVFNGMEYSSISGNYTYTAGLGYEGKAIYLSKNSAVNYSLIGVELHAADSIEVVVHLVPTHAVEGNSLRFSISISGGKPQIFDYETAEYSEPWKENVLRSQAIESGVFVIPDVVENESITIAALDEGIVIDQVVVYRKSARL